MAFMDGRPIGVLDIGSSKIACVIARMDGEPAEIIGAGLKQSAGIDNGAITDMAAAAEAIRNAVHAAEKLADETIDRVIVTCAGVQPETHDVVVDVAVKGHQISEKDLRRVAEAGRNINSDPDRVVLHALPIDYSIDGVTGIRDPRGLNGHTLSVHLSIITANRAVVRNLVSCIGRCHLDVEDILLGAYAAGFGCLTDDERALGALCIDLGAGTTSIGIFGDGEMVYADTLAIGGLRVTKDIAFALETSLADAEQLKTRYGGVLSDLGHGDDEIEVAGLAGMEPVSATPNSVTRSDLNAVIRPRMEEIFELVRERLRASGADDLPIGRIVLTGGGSDLSGIEMVAEQILERTVRHGMPITLSGVPQSFQYAAQTGVIGVVCAQVSDRPRVPVRMNKPQTKSRWRGWRQWLRESF